MKIWDQKQNRFKQYTPNWECTVLPNGEDFNTRTNALVKCAYCGKEIKFRESVMSHFIQPDDADNTRNSPSYAICMECAKKEADKEIK